MILQFGSKVLAKKYLTEEIVQFTLSAPSDFSFQPGQYVMLQMSKNGQTKYRAYSILNSPTEKGKIELCIKLIAGGFASGIFREMSEGAELVVKGPLGHFLFEEKGEEHWFVCVGMGMVPFYCMLKEWLGKYSQKKFKLIFSAKRKEELLFHQEFQRMAKEHPNFTYLPTLTRQEWKGATGRVQEHLQGDLSLKVFYLCGLREMVEETKEHLLKRGVEPGNIKVEKYN